MTHAALVLKKAHTIDIANPRDWQQCCGGTHYANTQHASHMHAALTDHMLLEAIFLWDTLVRRALRAASPSWDPLCDCQSTDL